MLTEYLSVVNIHIKRADYAVQTLNFNTFNIDDFDNQSLVSSIDSFVFRYSKLQDHIGKKLFPELLRKLEEYDESMPLIEILDKLEKLSLIPSSEKWMNYRDIRNQITHEYSNNKLSIFDNIKQSIIYFEEIKQIITQLEQYIKNKKL